MIWKLKESPPALALVCLPNRHLANMEACLARMNCIFNSFEHDKENKDKPIERRADKNLSVHWNKKTYKIKARSGQAETLKKFNSKRRGLSREFDGIVALPLTHSLLKTLQILVPRHLTEKDTGQRNKRIKPKGSKKEGRLVASWEDNS